MNCIREDVETYLTQKKCWKCHGVNLLAENPKYVNGEPVDIYGCVFVDSNGDFVIFVKVWCVDCRIWWTAVFTYDANTLRLKDVI